MRHLSDDAVVDVALGAAAAQDRAHAAECQGCSARVAEARDAIGLARSADVPEPSPFYWQSLRQGVSRRIAEESSARRRFGLLLPLLAAASLVAVVMSVPARTPRPAPEAPLAAWTALPTEDEDDGLAVLEGLDSGDVADWGAGPGPGAYLESLSDDESRAVAEGLRAREKGGES